MEYKRQDKMIKWEITIPMDFPIDWDKDMIEFHLNESSWCCDNVISMLEEISEEHGCICNFCKASVVDIKEK